MCKQISKQKPFGATVCGGLLGDFCAFNRKFKMALVAEFLGQLTLDVFGVSHLLV